MRETETHPNPKSNHKIPVEQLQPPSHRGVISSSLQPELNVKLGKKPAPYLADALALVQSWGDLSPTRQRDLVSAIRTAIRIDAVPDSRPAPLSAPVIIATFSCRYLNSRLFRQPHAVYGIPSADTFANILSQLRFALRRLGLHEPPYNGAHTLQPSWQQLHNTLTSKHRQISLSAFMRYCSAHSVEPEAATALVLANFEAWLLERTLCRDAPIRARAVASNWTWARANVPEWPDVELTRPRMREQYVLPFSAYPESLQTDAQRFLDRLSFSDVGDIFPDEVTTKPGFRAGRHRALKPRTIAGRSFQLRQCLAALVALKHDRATLTSLRSLVDPPERAHAIMSFFIKRANGQRTSQTGQIGEVLRQIARFHCKLEPDAETRITAWARNAAPKVDFAISEKNMRRVQALLNPTATRALVKLPQKLMEEAENPTLRPHAAALLALYATALAILLRFPMRRSNLAGLRLDRHLHRSQGKLIDAISLDASETKTGRAMLWPIKNKQVAQLIQVYIDQYRPHLTQPGNPYLFPQTGMKGRSAHDLAVGLTQLVEGRIGCEFNLHLVRHFVIALHLRRNPGHYDTARKILGHAAASYTTDVYTPLDTDAVARSLDETVDGASQKPGGAQEDKAPEPIKKLQMPASTAKPNSSRRKKLKRGKTAAPLIEDLFSSLPTQPANSKTPKKSL